MVVAFARATAIVLCKPDQVPSGGNVGMRLLGLGGAIAVGLLISASPTFAAITCWYDPAGKSTGSDEARDDCPLGKVSKPLGGGSNSDYAWCYGIDAPNGQSCPHEMKVPSQ
jgi:hypothetical protein